MNFELGDIVCHAVYRGLFKVIESDEMDTKAEYIKETYESDKMPWQTLHVGDIADSLTTRWLDLVSKGEVEPINYIKLEE